MSTEGGKPPGSASTSTSGDTVVGDLENRRQNLNSSNPRGNSNIGYGVDVAAAEADFYELNRQLSGISRIASRRLSKSQSKAGDPEKSSGDDDDEEGEGSGQFDLEGHLRGEVSTDRDAGIRAKKIGEFGGFSLVLGCGFGLTVYIRCCVGGSHGIRHRGCQELHLDLPRRRDRLLQRLLDNGRYPWPWKERA